MGVCKQKDQNFLDYRLCLWYTVGQTYIEDVGGWRRMAWPDQRRRGVLSQLARKEFPQGRVCSTALPRGTVPYICDNNMISSNPFGCWLSSREMRSATDAWSRSILNCDARKPPPGLYGTTTLGVIGITQNQPGGQTAHGFHHHESAGSADISGCYSRGAFA